LPKSRQSNIFSLQPFSGELFSHPRTKNDKNKFYGQNKNCKKL
jgi:hypothetical protein